MSQPHTPPYAAGRTGNRDSLTAASDPIEQRLIDLAVDRLVGESTEDVFGDDFADMLGLTEDDKALAEHLAVLLMRMADGMAAEALARLHNELQLPLVHATSWWQRPLGRLGITTRALCGERIVAGDVPGPKRKCRECERWAA